MEIACSGLQEAEFNVVPAGVPPGIALGVMEDTDELLWILDVAGLTVVPFIDDVILLFVFVFCGPVEVLLLDADALDPVFLPRERADAELVLLLKLWSRLTPPTST